MADFDLELIALLNQNNYALRRKIGEGYFRVAYEVVRHKGELKRRFVAKWERPNGGDSVQHKINKTKDRLSEREIELLNIINHPNIVQIYDLLQDEKRKIIIEEHFDAISLEEKVRMQGPILNQDFLKIVFSQVTDALRYLHTGGDILHRDLKPSNILIGRQTDLVKVADFQTASLVNDIELKLMPTRGATGYTHPDLVNTLLQGLPNGATIATEFYALGATLFYALIGKPPFRYKVNIVDDGTPLEIRDEKIYIALEEDELRLVSISPEEHDAKLEREIEPAPVRFKELLLNCLSLERKSYANLSSEEAHAKFKEDFDYAVGRSLELVMPLDKVLRRDLEGINKGKAAPEIDAVIEMAAGMVMKYGKRKKENHFQHQGFGGDRILSSTSKEIYSLNAGKLMLKLTDEADYYSFGTWSPGWREDYRRTLVIAHNDEQILEAHTLLGGEVGSLHEEVQILQPYDCWLITAAKIFPADTLSVEEEKKYAMLQQCADAGFIDEAKVLLEFLNAGREGCMMIWPRGLLGDFYQVEIPLAITIDGQDKFLPKVQFKEPVIEEARKILESYDPEAYRQARQNLESFHGEWKK